MNKSYFFVKKGYLQWLQIILCCTKSSQLNINDPYLFLIAFVLIFTSAASPMLVLLHIQRLTVHEGFLKSVDRLFAVTITDDPLKR